MSRHLLPALALSLLLLGCACGPAYAANGVPVNNVRLFTSWFFNATHDSNGTKVNRTLKSFHSPFLVGGGGVMVAFAEAQYTENVDVDASLTVLGHIGTERPNWADYTTDDNGNNWVRKWMFYTAEESHTVRRNPIAVIKENKTYLLALKKGPDDTDDGPWHLDLSVGEIIGELGNKTIKWEKSESLRSSLTKEVNRKKLGMFPGSSSSAFLTSKGTIVFSANATRKGNTSGFAIMQLKDEEQWEVSFVKRPEECRDVSLFEWEEKLISVFSRCSRSVYYARVYNEVSRKWKKYHEVLLGSKNSSKWVRDFIPVIIENKTVLLFTEESNSYSEKRGIRLWVTNGARAYDAGLIATHYNGIISGSLLYTNGELFFLHLQGYEQSKRVVFTRLDYQLGIIKSELRTWEEKDRRLVGQTNTPNMTATPKPSLINVWNSAVPKTATDQAENPMLPTDPEEETGTATVPPGELKPSTDQEQIPKAPTDPEEEPERPTGSQEETETTTVLPGELKPSTHQEQTPKAPTDPEEDSSEHMRMGVSLLFLLGLRALAVFFPASI